MVSDKVRIYSRSSERVCNAVLGQVTLTKLRLKKGALDKFRLPVDVIDGELSSYFPCHAARHDT